MKIKLSEETQQLFKELYCNGDYSEIARQLEKTEGNVDPFDSLKAKVRHVLKAGMGKPFFVNGITTYYQSKKLVAGEHK